MEIIICLVLFGIACIAIYSSFTSNKENTKTFEEIQEEEKEKELIKKELLKSYKNKTKKEIEKELKSIEDDYNELVQLARKKYEEENNENAIGIDVDNNLIDRSYEYRYIINYSLATKFEILNNILEENLYSIDTESTNYIIFAHLKYNTKEGIEKKVKYSAKVKFDVDDGQRIGFLYSDAIKKKRKDLGKMAVLLYSYINKVKAEEDNIVINLKYTESMKKYIDNSLTMDYVIENDNMIMTFETETPKEICKEINKIIKNNKNKK